MKFDRLQNGEDDNRPQEASQNLKKRDAVIEPWSKAA